MALVVLSVVLAKGSLCASTDTVIFSCELTNKKTISLCLEAGSKNVRYRAGTAKKLELEIVSEPTQKPKFLYAHYFRAQVDRSTFRFVNADTTYILFSNFDGEEKPTISKAGVKILLKGTEKEMACQRSRTMNFGDLDDWPCDTENELGVECPRRD
jgi:hypothetical protein